MQAEKISRQRLVDIETRLATLEDLYRQLHQCTAPRLAHPLTQTASPLDLTPFLDVIRESDLLKHIYFNDMQGGATTCVFADVPLEEEAIGGWAPAVNSGKQPLYLGGCARDDEGRRETLIPLCLRLKMPFFTPQGQPRDHDKVLKGLQTCGSAVFWFGGDYHCRSYLPLVDLFYLVAHQFGNLFFVQFPANLTEAVLTFDNNVHVTNIYGPTGTRTLRERKTEYYRLIRALIDFVIKSNERFTTREFTTLDGPGDSFHKTLATDTKLFALSHQEARTLSLTGVIEFYNSLVTAKYTTDTARALIVVFGYFLVKSLHGQQLKCQLLSKMLDYEEVEGKMRDLQVLRDHYAEKAGTEALHWNAFTELIDAASCE